jgi:hypothetical protein
MALCQSSAPPLGASNRDVVSEWDHVKFGHRRPTVVCETRQSNDSTIVTTSSGVQCWQTDTSLWNDQYLEWNAVSIKAGRGLPG